MFIKDFAQKEGVTTQAIYKLLKTHSEALEGHVLSSARGKDLDEYAQEYLKTHMVGNNVIVSDQRLESELADLRKRLLEAQNELIIKNQALINAQNQVLQIEDKINEEVKAAEDKLALELHNKYHTDIETMNKLHEAELQEERERKLTLSEALKRVFKKDTGAKHGKDE